MSPEEAEFADRFGLFFEMTGGSLTGYEKIQETPQRLLYRLMCATPMRNYDVLNRFAF